MKTIEEKNRMIADFIGIHEIMLDEESKYDTDDISHLLGFAILPKLSTISSDELLFHTSWEWLMPVVEKIEGIGYCVEIATTLIGIRDTQHNKDFYIVGININHATKLEATYKAVVQFIEWYNKTNN